MAIKRGPSFDPKSLFAKVGEGRSIGTIRKDQIVFSQGDLPDEVFYIQRGKVKVTVLSEQGKEAVVAILAVDTMCRSPSIYIHDPEPRHRSRPLRAE